MNPLHNLRAPRENGAVLAEPGLAQVGELVAENRRRLQLSQSGVDWKQIRREARQTALTAALEYLRAAGEPLPEVSADALLVTGHQPELFHPGVWVKNFALNGLARRHGVTALNLIVDNDTVKTTALHLPAMKVPPPPIEEFQPSLLSVPFDRWIGDVPYEERAVQDETLFANLPQRTCQDWSYTPLVSAFWEEVLRQARRTPLLGERFAAARRTFERRWGCHNLEVPVSILSRTEPFSWFAVHLLCRLPEFHALHNATVHDYRRRYGLRGTSHPVPDLAKVGDWLEAPFWAWRSGQTRRGRLFVRNAGKEVELRVGDEIWPSLPGPDRGNLTGMAAGWQRLQASGYPIRPRALTNTLYARVFLADLFIHGLGGGKYDELTDELIRGFYGFEPPAYMVLTATLLLPLPHYPASAEECRVLERDVRDIHWNPQRHLPGDRDPEIGRLIAEKQAWIERSGVTRRERREHFRELRRLTESLRSHLDGEEEELRRRAATCEQQVEGNRVLERRDYAFCLYPEEQLRPFCAQFLEGVG